MSAPYGGNNPAQWGQQPHADPNSGGFTQPGGYGQQPGYGQPAYGAPQNPQASQPQYGQQPAQHPYDPANAYGQQAGYPQQQGQYGGMYGQDYGQQPTHYGQQPPPQPGQPGQPGQGGKSGKGLWIGIVAAVVVLGAAAVVLFWKPGLLNTTTFDEQSVEQSVQRLVQESFGIEASDVDCPGDQPVEKGHTYSCTLTAGGEQQSVKITVTSEEGHYTVDKPSPQG